MSISAVLVALIIIAIIVVLARLLMSLVPMPAPVPAVTGGSLECTHINFLTTSGGDIVMGVTDADGSRLVEVRKR